METSKSLADYMKYINIPNTQLFEQNHLDIDALYEVYMSIKHLDGYITTRRLKSLMRLFRMINNGLGTGISSKIRTIVHNLCKNIFNKIEVLVPDFVKPHIHDGAAWTPIMKIAARISQTGLELLGTLYTILCGRTPRDLNALFIYNVTPWWSDVIYVPTELDINSFKPLRDRLEEVLSLYSIYLPIGLPSDRDKLSYKELAVAYSALLEYINFRYSEVDRYLHSMSTSILTINALKSADLKTLKTTLSKEYERFRAEIIALDIIRKELYRFI